jgi:dTDP-4-dehydrorhamnose 3,5-epimerase
MEFIKTPFEGLFVIEHNVLKDQRGFFARTFCKLEFKKIGFEKEFVQFNHSFNLLKGTVRGMHFQVAPFCETKLIRCIQGSVFDVVVDIRLGSPTYLQHYGIELSSTKMRSLLIPEGFAHGFQALENNSALIYHHTQFYNSLADYGIKHNDNVLGINWPLPIINISEKDTSYPSIDKNFKGIVL